MFRRSINNKNFSYLKRPLKYYQVLDANCTVLIRYILIIYKQMELLLIY